MHGDDVGLQVPLLGEQSATIAALEFSLHSAFEFQVILEAVLAAVTTSTIFGAAEYSF